MSDDLIERLRAAWPRDALAGEAADALAAKDAEIARLREARHHLEVMLCWADNLSLEYGGDLRIFREKYNAASAFLDGENQ